MIEQTGHGVSAIADKYGRDAFTFLDDFLQVTIPFSYKLDEYIKSKGNPNGTNNDGIEHVTDNGTEHVTDSSNGGKGLSDEEKLIRTIKENPEITTAEMVRILNKSRRTISRIIAKSSKIIRVGPDFGGHWEIKE